MNEQELFEAYQVLKDREAKRQYDKKKNRELHKIKERVIRDHFGRKSAKKKEKEAFKRTEEYRDAIQKMKDESEIISAGPVPVDYEAAEIREEFNFLRGQLELLVREKSNAALQRSSIGLLTTAARRQQKIDELQELNLDALIEKATQEYIVGKVREVEVYFQNNFWSDINRARYTSAGRRGRRSRAPRELSEVFEGLFYQNRLAIENVQDFLIGDGIVEAEIVGRMMDQSPELTQAVSDYSGMTDILIEHVGHQIDTVRIARRIAEHFTKERVLQLLRHNRECRGFAMQLERRIKRAKYLETAVLERIPENYIDLYPAARQMHRKFILHIGPTNSGKTYQGIEAMKKAENGIYLGPLRLLAFEQFEALNDAGYPCALLTGEESQTVPGARYQASTVEMLDLYTHYEVAVIDEAQLIHDRERGGAWCQAILGVIADEIHLCASPDAEDILIRMIKDCGDEYEVVRHHRMTPLKVSPYDFESLDDVRPHDALIVFSKKNVHAVASELQRRNVRCSIIYGSLPKEVRHEEARKFATGENDVLIATDAIGLGLNLPIERVVFLEVSKFDGRTVRELTSPEVKQIAGRAGRRGRYEIGYYTVIGDAEFARKRINGRNRKLHHAYIGFPEVLLSINAPLSELMRHWDELTPQEGFYKEDLRQELKLAEELERYSDDRMMIYRFCMMPFNADNPDLHERWLRYFQNEMNGVFVPFDDSDVPTVRKIRDSDELRMMEVAYETLDLDFYYYRIFRHDTELPVIQAMKNEISRVIIEFLSEQQLSPKKCKRCGRVLPWNFPFTVCDRCHSQETGRHYR